MADYDFDEMKINIDHCIKAIKVDRIYLKTAFLWSRTPQGEEYWEQQLINGFEPDAKSTIAYIVAQGLQFEMMESGIRM